VKKNHGCLCPPVQQRGGLEAGTLVSVLMNVNLALLNMLPIPVLDGGHYSAGDIEGIRR